MPHAYHQLHYHLVWSTKERMPLMLPIFINRLYDYMRGIFKNKNCSILEIGGMEDHIHILAEIVPTIAISELIRYIKVGSTKWVRDTFIEGRNFTWQEGYGAFSITSSRKTNVIRYIQNQKEHHKTQTFKDEFIWLLNQHHVNYDLQYLWK